MAGMADSDNPVTGPEDFSTDAGELQVGYKFLKSVGDETLPMEASEIVEFVNENSENLFGEAVHVFTARSQQKTKAGKKSRRPFIELRCSQGFDSNKYKEKKPALVGSRLTCSKKVGNCSFQVRIHKGTVKKKNAMVRKLSQEEEWKTALSSHPQFNEQRVLELKECMLRPSLSCEPLLLTCPLRRCGHPACVGSYVLQWRAFGPLQYREEVAQQTRNKRHGTNGWRWDFPRKNGTNCVPIACQERGRRHLHCAASRECFEFPFALEAQDSA